MRVPTMYVQHEDWELLKSVIKEATVKFGECSWVGIGYPIEPTEDEPMHYQVERIVYPEQENTAGSTEFDDDAMAAILAGLEEGERVIWHGHSHGNMDCFFSGDDNKLYSDWTKDMTADFFLMTIHTNKSNSLSQRFHWKGVDVNCSQCIIEVLGETEYEAQAQQIVDTQMSNPAVSFARSGYGGSWTPIRSAPPVNQPPALFGDPDDDAEETAPPGVWRPQP